MILVAAIDLIGSLRKPRASGDDPLRFSIFLMAHR